MDSGQQMTIRLYDFSHSSAPYRVRIALNLKGLAYEAISVNLTKAAHHDANYKAKNPQGLVPMLEVGDVRLTQTLAIIEWLDSTYPAIPLIPTEPTARAHMMAMTYVIAMEIHPINNLRVQKYLENTLGVDQAGREEWMRHWMSEGFAALETMANPDKPFLGGDKPGIADVCLVPQMFNARRFATPLEAFPKLVAIDAACTALDAFKRAHPDVVRAAG
jgi:maleylacetoacetate isomerase